MKNREIELESLIKRYKKSYYSGHQEISDEEYDALEQELRKLNPDNYVLKMVGSETISKDKVAHSSKMLSLDKIYDKRELINWISSNEVLSLFKIDGMSCSLVYKNKKMLAKTRGDGYFGEDITSKVLWMPSVIKDVFDDVEIRGELYCTQENFEKLSKEMEKLELDEPTSMRNIVAGIVGRKENNALCQFISFFAYDVVGKTFEKESEKFLYLKKMGFTTPDFFIHNDKNTIEDAINKASEFMKNGNYLIDGIVWVVNDIKKQNEMGETSHHPKYKMAFKFKGESKETLINSIAWQVSRNGILTPVAEVEPIEFDGAVLSRVTLHNYGIVKAYNLKTGDRIEIIRSGEVIPKFLSVVESSNNKFIVPKKCPSCKNDLEINDIRLVCNNVNCKEKKIAEIVHFVSSLEIMDLSEKRIEQLLDCGVINGISDLYKINEEDFKKIPKSGDVLAKKLIKQIQASKKTKLDKFMAALGIAGGSRKWKKIIEAGFNSIEKILNLKKEEISEIKTFADKSAEVLFNSLNTKKDLIKDLLDCGFTFEKIEENGNKLEGLSFCITGPLSEKREVIEERIIKNGGKAASSVSKNLSYLVTNETDSLSSKFKKAKELNIRIISEEDLKKML